MFVVVAALGFAPSAGAWAGLRQDEGGTAFLPKEVEAAKRAKEFEALLEKLAGLDPGALSEEERAEHREALKLCYFNAYWDFTRPQWRRGVVRLFPATIRGAREAWVRLEGDLTVLAKEEHFQAGRLMAQARFDDMRMILEQTAPYLLRPENPYLVRQQVDLAQILRVQGSWDQSQAAMDRARAHFENIPDSQREGLSRVRMELSGNQALIDCQRGDWGRARESLEELWSIGESNPIPIGLALGYKVEMQLHSRLHRYKDGLETWERAQADERLAEFWENEDGRTYWADLSASGALALAHDARSGSDPEAKEQALAEIERTLQLPALPAQRETSLRTRAGELLIQLGRFEEARQGMQVLDRQGTGNSRIHEQREAIAILWAKVALDDGGDDAELQAALEKAELAWQGVLDAWRVQDIRDEGLAVLWGSDRRELLALWMALQVAVHGKDAGSVLALDGFLELQSLGTLARSLGCERPSVEQVRTAILKPGHGLLILVPGLSRVVVIYVDSETVVAEMVNTDESTYRSRIAKLNGAIEFGRLSSSNAEVLLEARHGLAEIVFPPALRDELRSLSSISLVGTGSLDSFPYSYLPGLSDQPIGCELAVTLLPSIPLGVWMSQQAHPAYGAEPSLVVVACPDPGEEHGGIVGLPLDTALLLPGNLGLKRRSWLGEDVSLDGLNGADFGEDRLVHFVLHGIPDAAQTNRTAFALSGGQQLTLPELERMRLPPIVLVSACGANRAPLRKGDDGRNNLIGALQLAGCQMALAAHVEVDYRASLQLTERLINHAARGGTVAEALRRSRQELVADLEPGVHPSEYFLADLYGAPHTYMVTADEVKRAAPSRPWVWLVGAALVLVVGGALGLGLKRLQS